MIKPHPRFKPRSRIKRVARYTAMGLIGAAIGGLAAHSGIKIAERGYKEKFAQISRMEEEYSKYISQLPEHEVERLREQALPGGKPMPPHRNIAGLLLEKSHERYVKAVMDFYKNKAFFNKLSNVLLPSTSLLGFLSLYFLSKRRRRISQSIQNMHKSASNRLSKRMPRLASKIEPKSKGQLVLNGREVYEIFYSEGLDKLLWSFRGARTAAAQVRILSEIETILSKSPSAQQFFNRYKYFYADDAGHLIFTNK